MTRKSKGQIAYEAFGLRRYGKGNFFLWNALSDAEREDWRAAARAVVKACKKKGA